MSFTQLLYHIVFCTKEIKPVIPNDKSSELYKYIWGNIKNHNCHLYRINGMEEHIHRIGRTGRAGDKTGLAITLIEKFQHKNASYYIISDISENLGKGVSANPTRAQKNSTSSL